MTTVECRRRWQDQELREQLSTARAQQDLITADVWSVSSEEVGAPHLQSRSTRRLDETDSSDAASNAQRKRQNHVRHASDEEANEELPRQKQVRRSGDVSLDTPTHRRLRQHRKANAGTCCKRCPDFVAHSVLEPVSALRQHVCFSQLVGRVFLPPRTVHLMVRFRFFAVTSLTGKGHVLEPDETPLTNGALLLVVSSNGCFHSPNFIRQLLQAERLGIGAIPIIVEDCFQFPQTHSFRNSVLSRLACRLGQGESLTTSSR